MPLRHGLQACIAALICASCAHRPSSGGHHSPTTFVSTASSDENRSAVYVNDGRVEHVGTRQSAQKMDPKAGVVEASATAWAPAFAAKVTVPPGPPAEQGHDDELLLAPLREWLRTCVSWGLAEVETAPLQMRQWQALQTWDALGQVPLRVNVEVDGLGADSHELLERGPFSGRVVQMKSARFELTAALLAADAQAGLAEKVRAFSVAGFEPVLVLSDSMLLGTAETFIDGVQTGFGKPKLRLELEGAAAVAGDARPKVVSTPWVLSENAVQYTADKVASWLKASRPMKLKLLPGQAEAATSSFSAVAALLEACKGDADCERAARATWLARGPLAPGQPADLVGVSIDPATANAQTLRTAQVVLTVVDGVPVFQR